MSMIDFASLYAAPTPVPAPSWAGFPRYNFVGGHNDPQAIPVGELAAAASRVIHERGRTLATYHGDSGPLGDLSLRRFVADHLRSRSGSSVTPDEVLITAGSWQGIQLIAELLVAPGDTVLVEQHSFQHVINLLRGRQAEIIGIPMDNGGMRIDALATVLEDLRRRGVSAKFVYTIPTLQNPTTTVLELPRRHELLALSAAHGVPVFEDECYADLIWEGERPPALLGLDEERKVLHIGSFSKCLAPALRLGYLVAPSEVVQRLVTLKGDAGIGVLEQMVTAEYFSRHYQTHVDRLRSGLRRKLQVLVSALNEHFGTSAEFQVPRGGMFLWVRLPEGVDTRTLVAPASEAGVAFDDGPSWSVDGDGARRCLRLCFALPNESDIHDGIARLAEVFHREIGIPPRSANIER
jgi:2-aminoadipate transaminase